MLAIGLAILAHYQSMAHKETDRQADT